MKEYFNRALTYSLAVSIVAALFKIMHLPGANLMLIAGLSSLAIAAFAKNASEKTFEGVTAGAGIALAALGILFRLMHWPNSQFMLWGAAICAILWFGKDFISKKDTTGND